MDFRGPGVPLTEPRPITRSHSMDPSSLSPAIRLPSTPPATSPISSLQLLRNLVAPESPPPLVILVISHPEQSNTLTHPPDLCLRRILRHPPNMSDQDNHPAQQTRRDGPSKSPNREGYSFACQQCSAKFNRLAHLRRHQLTRRLLGCPRSCHHAQVTDISACRRRRKAVQLSILPCRFFEKGRHCSPHQKLPSRRHQQE